MYNGWRSGEFGFISMCTIHKPYALCLFLLTPGVVRISYITFSCMLRPLQNDLMMWYLMVIELSVCLWSELLSAPVILYLIKLHWVYLFFLETVGALRLLASLVIFPSCTVWKLVTNGSVVLYGTSLSASMLTVNTFRCTPSVTSGTVNMDMTGSPSPCSPPLSLCSYLESVNRHTVSGVGFPSLPLSLSWCSGSVQLVFTQTLNMMVDVDVWMWRFLLLFSVRTV